MQKTTIKTKVRNFSLNDPSEKVKNAEDYICIEISDIVEKFDENGDKVKTSFLNMKRSTAFNSMQMVNEMLNDYISCVTDERKIDILNILCKGQEIEIERTFVVGGEERQTGKGVYDNNTVINNIIAIACRENLTPIAEKRLAQFIEKGEQEYEEQREKAAAEKEKKRATINAYFAALAADALREPGEPKTALAEEAEEAIRKAE